MEKSPPLLTIGLYNPPTKASKQHGRPDFGTAVLLGSVIQWRLHCADVPLLR